MILERCPNNTFEDSELSFFWKLYKGALNAKRPQRSFSKIEKTNGREIGDFLTELLQQMHERSCNHFLWFPHTPKPQGS